MGFGGTHYLADARDISLAFPAADMDHEIHRAAYQPIGESLRIVLRRHGGIHGQAFKCLFRAVGVDGAEGAVLT